MVAASDYIERHCERQFNRAEVPSARVFEASARICRVDDFWTTDGLLVNADGGGDFSGPAWAATDFELFPLNGVFEGFSGWPFFKINSAGRAFPSPWRRRGVVQVTAKWGWVEVPGAVKQACLMQAAHLYKMSDAPNGVAGMDQFGAVRIRSLPQVDDLLCKFKRTGVLVG